MIYGNDNLLDEINVLAYLSYTKLYESNQARSLVGMMDSDNITFD